MVEIEDDLTIEYFIDPYGTTVGHTVATLITYAQDKCTISSSSMRPYTSGACVLGASYIDGYVGYDKHELVINVNPNMEYDREFCLSVDTEHITGDLVKDMRVILTCPDDIDIDIVNLSFDEHQILYANADESLWPKF